MESVSGFAMAGTGGAFAGRSFSTPRTKALKCCCSWSIRCFEPRAAARSRCLSDARTFLGGSCRWNSSWNSDSRPIASAFRDSPPLEGGGVRRMFWPSSSRRSVYLCDEGKEWCEEGVRRWRRCCGKSTRRTIAFVQSVSVCKRVCCALLAHCFLLTRLSIRWSRRLTVERDLWRELIESQRNLNRFARAFSATKSLR